LVGRAVRPVLDGLGYLGGLAILIGSAARACLRPSGDAPALLPAALRQADGLLRAGLPLVALVHVGIGSFLAMQAYFGATFVEAAGPVVVVGLVRNVAPLLTGLTMAGLLAARLVPELRRGSHADLDAAQPSVPDRDVSLGLRPDPREAPSPARLAAVRLLAAALVGPALAACGIVVGTLVGSSVASVMLGVSEPLFFAKALEMLWVRDVVGAVLKGLAFPMAGAVCACFEGLRSDDTDMRSLQLASVRATLLAMFAILTLNNAWFTLAYLAGPPFGPTVLAPPAP
jgi:phospholipid/cholesterol/gamma-HCH transport system permease protein